MERFLQAQSRLGVHFKPLAVCPLQPRFVHPAHEIEGNRHLNEGCFACAGNDGFIRVFSAFPPHKVLHEFPIKHHEVVSLYHVARTNSFVTLEKVVTPSSETHHVVVVYENWIHYSFENLDCSVIPLKLTTEAEGNVVVALLTSRGIPAQGALCVRFPEGFKVNTTSAKLEIITLENVNRKVLVTTSGRDVNIYVDELENGIPSGFVRVTLNGITNPDKAGETGFYSAKITDCYGNITEQRLSVTGSVIEPDPSREDVEDPSVLTKKKALKLQVSVLPTPEEYAPTCLAVCGVSGRIASAHGTVITMWDCSHHPRKIEPGKASRLQDRGFLPLCPPVQILRMETPLMITRLEMYQGYLAYASFYEARLVYMNVVRSRTLSKLQKSGNVKYRKPFSNALKGYGVVSESDSDVRLTDVQDYRNPPNADSIRVSPQHVECVFDHKGRPSVPHNSSWMLSIPGIEPYRPDSRVRRRRTQSVETRSKGEYPFTMVGHVTDASQRIDIGASLATSYKTTEEDEKQDSDDNILNKFPDLSSTDAEAPFDAIYHVLSCTLLVHRRFLSTDRVHSINLIPTPIIPDDPTQPPTRKVEESSKIKQQQNGHLGKDMRFFVSTAQEGFLYDTTRAELIASYNFSGDVVNVAVRDSLLIALTTDGVEVHTLWRFHEHLSYLSSPLIIWHEDLPNMHSLVAVNDQVIITPRFEDSDTLNPIDDGITLPEFEFELRHEQNEKKLNTKSSPFYFLLLTQCSYPEIVAGLINTAGSIDQNLETPRQLILEAHCILKTQIAKIVRYESGYTPPRFNLSYNYSEHNQELVKWLEETDGKKNPDELGSISDYDHCWDMADRNISEMLKSLLLSNYGILADLFYRLRDIRQAAKLYASSQRPPAEVFRLLTSKDADQHFLTLYLMEILYGSSKYVFDAVTSDPDFAETILAHFHKNSSDKFSSVFVETCIFWSTFSLEQALVWLDEIIAATAQQSMKKTSTPSEKPQDIDFQPHPMDLLARGLLCIQLNRIDESREAFLALGAHEFEKMIHKNPKLLTQWKFKKHLFEFLQSHLPWNLLRLLVTHYRNSHKHPESTQELESSESDLDELKTHSLYERDAIEAQTQSTQPTDIQPETEQFSCISCVKILRPQQDDTKESSGDILVEYFLESCIQHYLEEESDEVRPNVEHTLGLEGPGRGKRSKPAAPKKRYIDHTLFAKEKEEVATLLACEYLEHLNSQQNPTSPASPHPTTKHDRQLTFDEERVLWTKSHPFSLHKRHSWLNLLTPLSAPQNPSETPKSGVQSKIHDSAELKLETKSNASEKSINSRSSIMSQKSTLSEKKNPSSPHERRVHRLQALLCSSFPWDSYRVFEDLRDVDQGGSVKDSIMMLCLPMLRRLRDSLDLVVSNHPFVALEYARHYCKTVSDWDILLNLLVDIITAPEPRQLPGPSPPDSPKSVTEESSEIQSSTPTSPDSFQPRTRQHSIVTDREPTSRESYRSIYLNILQYLVTVLSPPDFLSLIPDHGNIKFYLEAIRKCFQYHHSFTHIPLMIQKARDFEDIEDPSLAIRAQRAVF